MNEQELQTAVILILVSVLSLFASFQLWRSNSALHDSDTKIRMVRQEEERLIAIRKAEENARKSTERAERAKEEIKRLKEQIP